MPPFGGKLLEDKCQQHHERRRHGIWEMSPAQETEWKIQNASNAAFQRAISTGWNKRIYGLKSEDFKEQKNGTHV